MPVWMKRLSLVFSIVAILIVWGCGTSIEKPLTKDEAIEQEEIQKEESEKLTLDNDRDNIVDKKEADGKTEIETKSDEGSDNDSDIENKENVTQASKSTSTVSNKKESSGANDQGNSSTKVKAEETRKDNSIKGENSKPVKQEKEKAETSNIKSTNNKTDKQKKSSETSADKKTNKSQKTNNKKEKPKESSKPEKTKEGSKQKPAPKKETNNTIIYSIVISSNEVPLPPTEMEISEGDTVLDALIKITKEKKIQMDYRGGQGASAYVEGIDNVYEFDRGPGSGWMYRVNGIFPDRGAGVIPLRPGDRVEWLYTTNLGEDLGADLQPFRR